MPGIGHLLCKNFGEQHISKTSETLNALLCKSLGFHYELAWNKNEGLFFFFFFLAKGKQCHLMLTITSNICGSLHNLAEKMIFQNIFLK